MIPDRLCEQARLSRDARFDGLFFTAVTSTRIYCRPVCPAPPPKPENVRYYASAAAAEAAGFRPCLRCRPELAPGNDSWQRGDHVIARALKLMEQGALEENSLEDMAQRLGIGARQLRRVFVERLGAPPIDVHTTRRLLFAKQLLTETELPVTDADQHDPQAVIPAGGVELGEFLSSTLHTPCTHNGQYSFTRAGARSCHRGRIVACLAIVAATFPLPARITGPEAARNE